MQDRQAVHATGVGSPAGSHGRGGIPLQPVDRSHLLRRPTEFPFPMPYSNGKLRIRRERRVGGAFTGIRSLARTDRG